MGDILTREEVAQLLRCSPALVRELGLCEACYLSHQPCTADQSEAIMAFRALWDSNPWVWVVGFRRV